MSGEFTKSKSKTRSSSGTLDKLPSRSQSRSPEAELERFDTFQPDSVIVSGDSKKEGVDEFAPQAADATINRVYGFKVHDPSTWPEYLKRQNCSPNDVRQGFTHNLTYLPKALHEKTDAQHLGEYNYPSLDVGTSYLCDPTAMVINCSFDAYYSSFPENKAAMFGTLLESCVTPEELEYEKIECQFNYERLDGETLDSLSSVHRSKRQNSRSKSGIKSQSTSGSRKSKGGSNSKSGSNSRQNSVSETDVQKGASSVEKRTSSLEKQASGAIERQPSIPIISA